VVVYLQSRVLFPPLVEQYVRFFGTDGSFPGSTNMRIVESVPGFRVLVKAIRGVMSSVATATVVGYSVQVVHRTTALFFGVIGCV